jgi:hypothetical protein
MYAAAEGKVAGISPSVGKEFLGHGVKNLPERLHAIGKVARKKKKLR